MRAWLKALLTRLCGLARTPAPAAPIGEGFRPAPAPPPPPPPPPSGMRQLLLVNGTFPQGGTGGARFTIGMIESFAGSYPAYGAAPCIGGMLPVSQHQPLVAVIGMNFGGDGMRQIGLPDLRGRVAVGGASVGRTTQGALTLTWLIATDADSAAPMLGAVMPFGGGFAPQGWAACDGTMLRIPDNVALFNVIGTAFGGTPGIYFQLPDLNGAAPVGVGPVMPRGGRASGAIDGLGLTYLINLTGPVAPVSGNGAAPAGGGYAGQVLAFAGAQIPEGWAICDGSMLAVSTYPALFQAIGNSWGGDGRTSFALPDLRGKMLPGC